MDERFRFVSDEADRAVLVRIKDIVSSAEKWRKPCFSLFLTEHEQAVIEQYFAYALNGNCSFFGGYDMAERRVFCAFPDEMTQNSFEYEDYPFKALTIILPKGYTLTHRDILGSLMGLKIKRESVGDILIGESYAVVFLLDAAAKLALSELDKIGRVGVKCNLGLPEVLPAPYKLLECRGVVSSMRVDAIVSMLTDISRSESARLINQGLVLRNAQVINSTSKDISEGDKISIRGYGKFKIESIGGETRKGRLHIIYNKYI